MILTLVNAILLLVNGQNRSKCSKATIAIQTGGKNTQKKLLTFAKSNISGFVIEKYTKI